MTPVRLPTMATSTQPVANPLFTIRQLIFTAERSFADLSRASGLSSLVVRRLAINQQHSRLNHFFIALGKLDVGIIARTRNEVRWRVLALPFGHSPLPDGNELSQLVIGATTRISPLTVVIATTGLSRCTITRLRRGLLPPVITAVLHLLAAVDGELIAIGGDGSGRALLLPILRPKKMVPIRKSRSPNSSRPKRGKLTLNKGDILTMRQEMGMSCARIAAIAGVSAERVRQILMLFGAEPLRQRQRRLRVESYQRASPVSATL